MICLILSFTQLTFLPLLANTPKDMDLPATDYNWIKKEEMPELIKMASQRRKDRKVANVINEKTQMSDKYREFRDKFITLTTSEQVAEALDKLNNEYHTYPNDLKFIAAHLIPLKTFRGITWRLIPLVEKQNITHSMLLTQTKKMAAQMKVYFPDTKHMEASFSYVTEPFMVTNKEGQVELAPRIHDDVEFQLFLTREVYPALQEKAKRLKNLNFSSQEILWDNKIIYGTESFVDDLDRFKILGEADRHFALSNTHQGLSFLSFICGYSLKNLFSYIKEQGKLYGVDGFGWGTVVGIDDVDGVSSYKKVKIAERKEFSELFTLHTEGKLRTMQALVHLKESIYQLKLVWEEIKDRPSNEFAFLNPGKITPWKRVVEADLDSMMALVEGPTELTSAVDKKTVQVDLPRLFNDPEPDLKKLLPILWETHEGKEKTKTFSNGEKTPYTNYYWGRPKLWNKKIYQKYFLNLKNGADVKNKLRILSQAFGGSTIANPISHFSE